MIIPRVFHRVWVGDAPIPEQYETWWEAFQAMHPDWEFFTWRDADLEWLQNRSLFDTVATASEKSDVARYEIVAKHGGVYIDADVEPIRPFDPILRSIKAFAGWEFGHRLCTAVLGSKAGHPAILKLVEELPAWAERFADKKPDKKTGPQFLTAMWWKERHVERFHRDTFYPVGWWEREKLGGPYPKRTVAVHHWAGSWVNHGA